MIPKDEKLMFYKEVLKVYKSSKAETGDLTSSGLCKCIYYMTNTPLIRQLHTSEDIIKTYKSYKVLYPELFDAFKLLYPSIYDSLRLKSVYVFSYLTVWFKDGLKTPRIRILKHVIKELSSEI